MLPHNTIVATVYSNLGLSRTFAREGGKVVITQNGDRYVLEQMRKLGVILGGEQSGHIIFLDRNTTGMGYYCTCPSISSSYNRREIIGVGFMDGSIPASSYECQSQQQTKIVSNSAIDRAVERAEALISKEGRIFVRPSGTEPLVRILGEGPEESVVRTAVSEVARVIQEELG